jgi:hypothetical protein
VLKPDLVAPGTRIVSAEAARSYLSTTYPERHVAGAGADAYLQLSGTSMAAAVVTGAVSLLLEQRPKLTPRETKAVLQLTSSVMPGEGLVASGAGSLNLIGATLLLKAEGATSVTIAGESVHSGGVCFFDLSGLPSDPRTLAMYPKLRTSADNGTQETIIWGQHRKDTIIWGQVHDSTIIWGQTLNDTIIWGQTDTIIWGQTTDPTIIWGQAEPDTIIWGQGSPDTIIWGQSSPRSSD